MTDAHRHALNLASQRLGAAAIFANDEFFAAKENLIADAAPIFLPDKYVATGKWMDGWETRRRREPGHDFCIVRLGARGVPRHIVVDTSFFRGNFPAECSIDACDLPLATPASVACAADWVPLVPRSPLAGDSRNELSPTLQGPVTHLRLNIFPDGGVARLRVYGDAAPDRDWLDLPGGLCDLGAAEHGARIVDCSDAFFGEPLNMLMPGRAADMSDGWETRRRRGPGHDFAVIELAAPGSIEAVEVDTSHFKGNAPGTCAIDVASAPGGPWTPLLPMSPLCPHTVHRFGDELAAAGTATHVRIQIHPCGGIARLRLWGRSERSIELTRGLFRLATMDGNDLASNLLACCGSTRWVQGMTEQAPFVSASALMRTADRVWRALEAKDWLEAFAAHPRIGEKKASAWSRAEQAGVDGASEQLLAELADANRDYEQRFGHIFLICATGKSAAEMLASLRRRVDNPPHAELAIAAEEQRKITRLRLEKWLRQP